jgi:hypothetical protein
LTGGTPHLNLLRRCQIHLIQERQLAASSILVAISALRFLYNVTLQKNWNFDLVIQTPEKTQALPVVLSPEKCGGCASPTAALSRGALEKKPITLDIT